MIYLILSICCSVTVGVLLKLAKRYSINVNHAITFNYLFAIGLSYFFFRPVVPFIDVFRWELFIPLGILLPLIFWCLAISVREHGIARTDIAQRLSLFISLLAAWILFNESFTLLKLAGLAVGLAAIFLILKRTQSAQRSGGAGYLLCVFAGFGVIDVLFKQVAKNTEMPYTTSLFLIFITAFLISGAWLAYQLISGRQKLELVNFFCGAILGVFNFGNILFYLKAHKAFAENPSTVFAAMNLGVIVLGSLTGVFVFREKLSRQNYLGVALAIAAVIMITIAQIYAV